MPRSLTCLFAEFDCFDFSPLTPALDYRPLFKYEAEIFVAYSVPLPKVALKSAIPIFVCQDKSPPNVGPEEITSKFVTSFPDFYWGSCAYLLTELTKTFAVRIWATSEDCLLFQQMNSHRSPASSFCLILPSSNPPLQQFLEESHKQASERENGNRKQSTKGEEERKEK